MSAPAEPRPRRPLVLAVAALLTVAGIAAAWWAIAELSEKPPEVGGLSSSIAYEGEPFSYVPNATQAGFWTLQTNASWLSVEPTSGRLSGTPPASGGSYYAALTLTNANGTAELNLTITVKLRLVDDGGRELVLDRPAERLISLAPSNTELLFALGVGGRVVGTAPFSDYPPEASEIPVVVSLGYLDTELIVTLEPDLIFAAGITSPAQRTQLEDLGLPTLVLEPKNLSGIVENIFLAGRAVGAQVAAQRLAENFTAGWENVTRTLANVTSFPRTFYLMDTFGGYWTAGSGTFIDEFIREAGGTNIASEISGWFIFSAENITASDPEVIILAAYAMVDETTFASDPFWGQLTAVKEGRVYRITDQNLFDRPGPRLVMGLEILAQWLHPEAYAAP